MVDRVYLNNGWKFTEEYLEKMEQPAYCDSHWQEVRIPHTCKEIPLHYFDEEIYQMLCIYRKTFVAEKEWKENSVLLTFEGIAHECEVFLNGEKVGEHHCGYTAFTLDISQKLKYGEENVLAVKVDSRETGNVPPFGFVVDYMTYGGIYREVYLDIKSKVYLKDVYFQTEVETLFSNEVGKKVSRQADVVLKTEIAIKNSCENLELFQYIRKKGTEKFECLGSVRVQKKEEKVTTTWWIENVYLWDVESPALYEIKTQLKKENQILDECTYAYGFRKAEFLKKGFYLNGRKLKIIGLNRHQSYAYVGYAMPKSMQQMDAEILKNELGLNAVRTSHYPQSHHFLNRCDELGLLVFTEIPGWQHIGDEKWQAQAVKNAEDMVKQYRNHTSIILWGVRINESADCDALYRLTNETARKLDSQRATGGVRASKKSSFLEDVYTYNDFSHNGKNKGCEKKKKITPDKKRAYLISEYNGHMYPTKSFDTQEHRTEHAIRHANVLNEVAKNQDIAGSFGWCMADYNTHKDFGSGDRICYHGVMDMFRNPKSAAYVYACQQDKEIQLFLTSSMDIGEHPECIRGKNWIFSNADSVRMYKNDRFIKEYKIGGKEYPYLKHGPILIDDYIGDAIEKNENFKKSQAKDVCKLLNATAMYGLSYLPKRCYFLAAKMMLFYGMKMQDAVSLYHKYIGDWGGMATEYKFEAIKDGKVVKTVVKSPMKNVHIEAMADHVNLLEETTYDVAAIRICAKDEWGNVLPFYQEPITIHIEGPVACIGPKIISLKGGMAGTYVKTLGIEGKAKLTIETTYGRKTELGFQVNVDKIHEK